MSTAEEGRAYKQKEGQSVANGEKSKLTSISLKL